MHSQGLLSYRESITIQADQKLRAVYLFNHRISVGLNTGYTDIVAQIFWKLTIRALILSHRESLLSWSILPKHKDILSLRESLKSWSICANTEPYFLSWADQYCLTQEYWATEMSGELINMCTKILGFDIEPQKISAELINIAKNTKVLSHRISLVSWSIRCFQGPWTLGSINQNRVWWTISI